MEQKYHLETPAKVGHSGEVDGMPSIAGQRRRRHIGGVGFIF
jgi:hypothetical protein